MEYAAAHKSLVAIHNLCHPWSVLICVVSQPLSITHSPSLMRREPQSICMKSSI